MRDAFEGTKERQPASGGGPIGAPVVARRKKSAVDKVRSTTGTAAGGSLAASRPGSARSYRPGGSVGGSAIEQDLAMASRFGM